MAVGEKQYDPREVLIGQESGIGWGKFRLRIGDVVRERRE